MVGGSDMAAFGDAPVSRDIVASGDAVAIGIMYTRHLLHHRQFIGYIM